MSLDLSVALIAGLLYAAAYFRFVHLLRYPRNWVPTSKTEIGICIALVVLVAIFVSMSTGEFDATSPALSIGFISLLFFVIAAPAVAFLPTHSVVEFFAKHGDHAGLWFAPFALAAGVAIPNAGLRGMLLTAIFIELMWFFHRRRQDHNRVWRPLDEPVLTVLRRQADDDLASFAKKHRIGELVLGEKVGWLGCTKASAPCPFNLYVNKLGLNTAPCCRDHLIALCRYADECLTDAGVAHWLEGGSLLGAVRDGGLLAWEDDVDISVMLDDQMTWDRLVSELSRRIGADGYAFEVFPEHEVVSFCFDRRRTWPLGYERNRLRGDLRVDISAYREAVNSGQRVLERHTPKAAMPATENGKYGVPIGLVVPTTRISVFDGSISCPQNSDGYLRLLYGDYSKVAYTYIDPDAAKKRSDDTTQDH